MWQIGKIHLQHKIWVHSLLQFLHISEETNNSKCNWEKRKISEKKKQYPISLKENKFLSYHSHISEWKGSMPDSIKY